MSQDQVIVLVSQLFWAGLLIAGPILLATLLVGLLVSLFQVVTQLREMSLSYVPKLVVAAAVIVTLGPWMLTRLTGFASTLFGSIGTIN